MNQTPPAKIFEFDFQKDGFRAIRFLKRPNEYPWRFRGGGFSLLCVMPAESVPQVLGLALVKGARVLGIEDVGEVWFYLGRV